MNTTLYYNSQADGTTCTLISNQTGKFLVNGDFRQKPNIS